MHFLYNLGIQAYTTGIALASPVHKKARALVQGRKNWKKTLKNAVKPGEKWIWFHCASLGEFEQGRPLIEQIRSQYPDKKILLSFFSPSGYEIRRNYAHADAVVYLPADSPRHVRLFLDLLQPELVFFVKYELWVNFHLEMARRHIPVFLVSARMLPGSSFFRGIFKNLYRQVFAGFAHIFTQDDETAILITSFSGNTRVSVSGDTRFDRVAEVAAHFSEIEGIRTFIGKSPCLVCGSTWHRDEDILLRVFEKTRGNDLKWIIAPHEVDAAAIGRFCEQNREQMIPFSRIEHAQPWHRLLWIDNIGMLSRLYHYADFTYVGGGFNAGIHNILEPAVYGNPVMFGPKHEKFAEAVSLVAEGGAFVISSRADLEKQLRRWMDSPEELEALRARVQAWAQAGTGATEKILSALRKEGYLA